MAAAQCEYGQDFEELKQAKFKVANGRFTIPITLARKSSVVMQRVQMQPPQHPEAQAQPTLHDGSACLPGTTRTTHEADKYVEDFCWTSQFQKQGPYEMRHTNGDRDVGQYDHGQRTGAWTYFGKFPGIIRFENDLEVEGKITRSSDGSLRLRIETVDGVTIKTWFRANGEVEETERYQDGKLIPSR